MASSAKKTSQKFAKTKRSDDKTRSTRCLLQCSSMRRHEEICKVSVGGQLLRILMPLLWSRSSSKILLRRINIRLIIYLDDILIMGETLAEILVNQDSIIFLIQHLGFVINIGKSQLEPSTEIQFLGVNSIRFLGVKINSLNMTMHLPE